MKELENAPEGNERVYNANRRIDEALARQMENDMVGEESQEAKDTPAPNSSPKRDDVLVLSPAEEL